MENETFQLNTAAIEAEAIHFIYNFQGKEYPIKCPPNETIKELKQRLYDMTNVMPARQKLLGLKSIVPGQSSTLSDDAPVSRFGKTGARNRFLFMGTPESQIPEEPSDRPSVFDDFDYDYVPDVSEIRDHAERAEKLKQAISLTEIRLINPLDPKKKMLVLDLDHTLFDFGSRDKVATIQDTARPGLEEFLSAVYPYYNLVVWSQTSWRWLEVKLTELNLLTNPRFQFAFVLDKESMFKVKTYQKQKKEVVEHYVKPLQLIWSLLGPQWNEKNTVHVDDLGRNFVMNPRNGILVKAFYVGSDSKSDRELYDLAKYLVKIASRSDIGSSENSKWRNFLP